MKLTIENLTYRIGDFLILDQVTGEITPGDAVCLVGPNGAGKTTLANIISGFLSPSSGKVSLNSCSLASLSPPEIARLGVSRMFQNQHLAWNLSTLDNVLVGFDRPQDVSWTRTLFRQQYCKDMELTKRERSLEILRKVGLFDQMLLPARDLSFGQQRLLALARALAHQCR